MGEKQFYLSLFILPSLFSSFCIFISQEQITRNFVNVNESVMMIFIEFYSSMNKSFLLR